MLKILHTADWHLGQKLFGFDRIDEQRHVLLQIERIVIEEQVDVVLIAGDVFDTLNPSSDAQKLFYDFCAQMVKLKRNIQVVIIAGNHDSSLRLKAGEELLKLLNVHVVSGITRLNREPLYQDLIIPLKKADGSIEAVCMAVPFLRSSDLPDGRDLNESYSKFYRQVYDEALRYDLPIIVMGHLYVMGAQFASSSFDKLIGTLEASDTNIFPADVSYVALGHIHRKQQVSENPLIYYSGSPMPLSFTERNYTHGVLIVSLCDGTASVKDVPIVPLVPLITIKGTENEIIRELDKIPTGEITPQSPYLTIVLLSDTPRPDLFIEFKERCKEKSIRLTHIRRERLTAYSVVSQNSEDNKTLHEVTPIDVAKRYYFEKYSEEMPQELSDLLERIIKGLSHENIKD